MTLLYATNDAMDEQNCVSPPENIPRNTATAAKMTMGTHMSALSSRLIEESSMSFPGKNASMLMGSR